MLRKFVLLAIFIATTFGVSGMINGWPKTAIACGVIVLLLMIIFCFRKFNKTAFA